MESFLKLQNFKNLFHKKLQSDKVTHFRDSLQQQTWDYHLHAFLPRTRVALHVCSFALSSAIPTNLRVSVRRHNHNRDRAEIIVVNIYRNRMQLR